MSKKEYHVTWTIEVDGDSPEDAARNALAIQRDPESSALVFLVTKRGEALTDVIDLWGDTHE